MNSILVSLFLVAAAVGCLGAPGPNCSPATLEEQPPSVKRICFELFKIFNPNAEQALMDEGYLPVLRDGIYDKVIRPDGPDYKVKRQDVDHVFLRFGRRR